GAHGPGESTGRGIGLGDRRGVGVEKHAEERDGAPGETLELVEVVAWVSHRAHDVDGGGDGERLGDRLAQAVPAADGGGAAVETGELAHGGGEEHIPSRRKPVRSGGRLSETSAWRTDGVARPDARPCDGHAALPRAAAAARKIALGGRDGA